MSRLPAWSGFLPPIYAAGDRSVSKLGSTVPVKSRLSGESAGVTARISTAKLGDTLVPGVLEAPNSNPASPGDLFSHNNGPYIYNLGTQNMSPGLWQIGADLGNGITQSVVIELRK